jgi:myosin-1
VGDGRQAGGKPQVRKAVFESTKKKEIGVSDLTLLSKISNEAINDNLKLRFQHDEIYVSRFESRRGMRGRVLC